ncbi:hypothetical protein [Actinopolymorpha alba]|uniref:hypothetical protein n=1 Tax=Actinopolymorpha alba TaxID=533267 RepID=UPI0003A8E7B5|nr:hypothetical protein [Actinopolymorpha alba]
MSNPYDSMAGAVGPGKEFGNIAFYSSLAACAAFPELLLPVSAAKSGILLKQVLQRISTQVSNRTSRTTRVIRFGKSESIVTQFIPTDALTSVPMRLFLIRTDTAKMMEACSKIHEAAKLGSQLYDELRRHGDSITDQNWKAADQEEFSTLLTVHGAGILATAQLGYVTATMTALTAMLRFVQLLIAMVIMVILAAMAVAFWIAMAIPGGQGVAMSIRNFGRPLIKTVQTIIRVMDEIMIKVGWAHAGLVGIMGVNAAAVDGYKIGDIEGGGWQNLGDSAVDIVDNMLEKWKRAGLKGINGLSGF